MKTIFSSVICMSLLSFAGVANASEYLLASPDGRTQVCIADAGGALKYSVKLDGKDFIMPSPFGMLTNIGDYRSGLSILGTTVKESVDESYSLPNIKRSKVDYKANAQSFKVGKDGQPVFDVEFEVSDNNVAFRYRLLPQKETLCCVVEEESTGFYMPEGTTTFLCPQSGPMGGFARTAPSYETNYTLDDTMGKNGWGNGYSFPCLFRNGDNGWTLISETGIAGDYVASHLTGKDGGEYQIAYAQTGEQNGFGSTGAAIALPGYTPWRTVTVGETLAPIVETTVPFDVVEPLYEASRPYKYGKGVWSWIIKMDPSCNFDEQKRYVDFAADMGYETVLVDALWDTQIGYEGIERLAQYAKSKGVALYLWYNSNGSWNDAPQGPRGIMSDIVKRRKAMKWMQENGVRGIKVDFFGGDKQETMRLYEAILSDADDHGLMVIFHGCTLPRGWERMYPNYVGSEAVRASENMYFTQQACDDEAFNATLHPFIRNSVGCMEFGGCFMNKYISRNNRDGHRRMTSDAFQLATTVLFQNPVQNFAITPYNLEDAPAVCMDYLREVPTVWDETRFIEGYPGRYVVLARRHADKWYIAGVNATGKPVTVTLDSLAKGDAYTLYCDDADRNPVRKDLTAGKKAPSVTMQPGGGFVVIR